MLQQYLELKSRYPDCIMLYRLGDFYELFFEDAERAAPVLGLVLTRRRHNAEVTSPMCGIPHHALANYVGKLLDAGWKVAVVEQVEDPAKAAGLVRRDVVRILTPGTVTEPELLGAGDRRFLVAVAGANENVAVAYLEAASGDFGGCTLSPAAAAELLGQLRPSEVVLAERGSAAAATLASMCPQAIVTIRPAARFEVGRSDELLRRALSVGSLRAFELEPGEALIGAAGALVDYLRETQGQEPTHLRSFERRRTTLNIVLDAATVRNLELLRDAAGGKRTSLVHTLDHTVTPMGARLLGDWLLRPLGDQVRVTARHAAVAALIDDPAALAAIRELLSGCGDLERIAGRLGLKQARPGELAGLRAALAVLDPLRAELAASPSQLLAELGAEADPLADLATDLAATLADEPPALFGPGVIRTGCDEALDEARRLAHGAKEVLAEIEASARAATGITTLKIRYNRVFGYGFEVSKSHLERVPSDWVRRQTLANGERFTMAGLEDLERRIAAAEGEAGEREQALWATLLDRGAAGAGRLAATARAVAAVDVLAAFADRARQKNYVRPRLVAGARVCLVAARHPVIEEVAHDSFVPNDVSLDGDGPQIMVLTGPNMGGKSTFLRQIALAVVMAGAGSFVAAQEAEIGEVDRIFTRAGAGDDLARGESTFMVEMTEVANIVRHATARSLVLLDEVGRGTATFDGLSLAWALVEALHDPPGGEHGPLVVFATHYHELTDLAERLDRVANASVAVKEWQGSVLFLHRVVPGPSDRSYGIHVAKLAGVPAAVCTRARAVLRQLERQEFKVVEAEAPAAQRQLALFPAAEEIVARRLRSLDVDTLTPIEALNTLAELKGELAE